MFTPGPTLTRMPGHRTAHLVPHWCDT